jgi:hypothetical protein
LKYSDPNDPSNFISSVLPEKQRIFGMYVNNNNFSISLGGIDDTLIAKGEEKEGYGIHWYPLIEPMSMNGWAIELQDARYNYMSFVRGNAKMAVFSSG